MCVIQIGKFRGLVTVTKYAPITMDPKRGRVHDVLDNVRVQRAVLMFIVRVWTKNVTKDMKLCDEVPEVLSASSQL